jgi:general secretion pathway protein N
MRRGLLAAGLGAYAIGLIVTAPATLGDAILQSTSGSRLRLAEAQGTLWSGAGQFEIRDAGGRIGIANRLAWRVSPDSFLRGRLVVEVELDNSARRFPVAISLSTIEIDAAEIHLPATVLGVAVPGLAPLRLSGDVVLHVARLSIGRSGVRGAATLRWRAAGSALTPVWPLGDYEVLFEGDGTAVHGRLRTLRGPLQLDGKGSWVNGDNPAFDATARIPPQHQEKLAPLLRLVAIERGTGTFALQSK